jgi:hypothetical protein
MRKNTRKTKITKKKTINNTIEKEKKGGFDSLKVAPREAQEHKEKHQEAQNHQGKKH